MIGQIITSNVKKSNGPDYLTKGRPVTSPYHRPGLPGLPGLLDCLFEVFLYQCILFTYCMATLIDQPLFRIPLFCRHTHPLVYGYFILTFPSLQEILALIWKFYGYIRQKNICLVKLNLVFLTSKSSFGYSCIAIKLKSNPSFCTFWILQSALKKVLKKKNYAFL